jgi:guanylate kinase
MSNEGRRGNIIVVSAPSGGGKTTLCRKVIAAQPDRIRFSVSHTTRPPRGQERDGVDYHFVSDAEFDRMVAASELAEWAPYQGRRYGTSLAELERAAAAGQDLFLDIESEGALQIKRRYPSAVLVYVLPPSVEELRRRLVGRATDSADAIERRLANARREAAYAAQYDYIVVNDVLEDAVGALAAIVEAARRRRENMQDAIARLVPAP